MLQKSNYNETDNDNVSNVDPVVESYLHKIDSESHFSISGYNSLKHDIKFDEKISAEKKQELIQLN